MISPCKNEYYYYTDRGVQNAWELQYGGGYTEQRKKGNKITFYFWISCCGYLNSDYENYVKDDVSSPKSGRWNGLKSETEKNE